MRWPRGILDPVVVVFLTLLPLSNPSLLFLLTRLASGNVGVGGIVACDASEFFPSAGDPDWPGRVGVRGALRGRASGGDGGRLSGLYSRSTFVYTGRPILIEANFVETFQFFRRISFEFQLCATKLEI